MAVAAACLAALAGAGPAAAQAGGCPSSGNILSTADVRVTSPAPGSAVTGPNVTVRGTASAGLLAQLTRVEVRFGGEVRGRSYDAASSIDFEITVDASEVPAGPTLLSVVACGLHARGDRQFSVAYQPRAAVPTTAVTSPPTTSVSVPGDAVPSEPGAPSTTAVTGPVSPPGSAAPGQPSTTAPGQTTIASTPPATAADAALPAPA
ncbi:MAG TPA: hypothetical protein VM390_09880, partial [Acidimicrobiales bacterium]|nr:hypothetical protein [Acidimicrobiales bacterium]